MPPMAENEQNFSKSAVGSRRMPEWSDRDVNTSDSHSASTMPKSVHQAAVKTNRPQSAAPMQVQSVPSLSENIRPSSARVRHSMDTWRQRDSGPAVIYSSPRAVSGGKGASPIKKTDPVSAFHSHQAKWSANSFLQPRSKNKLWVAPPPPVLHRNNGNSNGSSKQKVKGANTYVPPTDNRRDKLRAEVRARMSQQQFRPATASSKRVQPAINLYVPPTERRRDELIWGVRVRMNA
jgi:hypothetical protein